MNSSRTTRDKNSTFWSGQGLQSAHSTRKSCDWSYKQARIFQEIYRSRWIGRRPYQLLWAAYRPCLRSHLRCRLSQTWQCRLSRSDEVNLWNKASQSSLVRITQNGGHTYLRSGTNGVNLSVTFSAFCTRFGAHEKQPTTFQAVHAGADHIKNPLKMVFFAKDILIGVQYRPTVNPLLNNRLWQGRFCCHTAVCLRKNSDQPSCIQWKRSARQLLWLTIVLLAYIATKIGLLTESVILQFLVEDSQKWYHGLKSVK